MRRNGRKDDQLITLTTGAKLARVSRETMRRHAEKGTLPAQRFGRNWLTTREAVLAWKRNKQLHKRGPKPA